MRICVTICGPVASGKSSLARFISESLRAQGVEVEVDDAIDHRDGLPDRAYAAGMEKIRDAGVHVLFAHTPPQPKQRQASYDASFV